MMCLRTWPLLASAVLASGCGQSKSFESSSGRSAGFDAGGGADAGAAVESGADGDAGAGASVDASNDGQTVSACSPPGTLCWGFEEGTFPPGWSRYRVGDGFAGQLLVDNTMAHSGSYSLHAKDFSGGSPGEQGGPKYTIIYTLPSGFGPVLWGRAFVYMTPEAPESHAGIFNARYPPPGSNATAMSVLDWYEVATDSPTGMTPGSYMEIWHVPEPPGQPEDVRISDAGAVVGNWACLEWLFDGTPDDAGEAAEPRLWLNGAELTWPSTFIVPSIAAAPFRQPVSNFIELETGIYMYQGLTTVTNWWIDDLAVGPQRIGCD
jgi:hypothetical protein